jgi:hypothetical protein
MEENNCTYINSMGFRKSCDMYSIFNNYHVNDYDFTNLKENDVLYIKTDALYHFSQVINNIHVKFVLVSGCSDFTIPNDIFPNEFVFIQFIENNKIIKWFVQNCIYKHDKIVNLPIGLDYHTLNTHQFWWGEMRHPKEQEIELDNIIKISKPYYERQLLIYSNCHFLTTTKYGNDRLSAINTIPSNLIVLEKNKICRNETWNRQINYMFVLSPHGNGYDCHRTWEALILGCIPIVKTSEIDILYEDLPVLIVNNWSEINIDLLKKTISDFKSRAFNFEKLTLKYWLEKMKTNN